jgi:hypothetical protein
MAPFSISPVFAENPMNGKNWKSVNTNHNIADLDGNLFGLYQYGKK